MKLSLPENVCDSHVHVGIFPTLQIGFTLKNLKSIIEKYMLDSVLVFPSHVDSDKYMEKILKAVAQNKHLYALMRSKPLNYSTPKFLKRLDKLLNENHRIAGMKINPSTEKHRITDELYRGCLEILNDQKKILVLHCGRWVEMAGWHYGVEIAKRYPKLKMILAHMGGTHPDLSYPAIESVKNLNNVYLDTSQTRQLEVIRRGIEHLGASRILFASDMPWGNYVQNLIGIQQLNLDRDVEEKVLRGNFNKIVKGTC